jgi:hypothetical protein
MTLPAWGRRAAIIFGGMKRWKKGIQPEKPGSGFVREVQAEALARFRSAGRAEQIPCG